MRLYRYYCVFFLAEALSKQGNKVRSSCTLVSGSVQQKKEKQH
jgi:hypothetical protein